MVEIVHSHTLSHKFKDEEVGSHLAYPSTYRVRPVEAQVTELRKVFPSLSSCMEKLGRIPLPDEPEGWFAIPRWQALAPTYNEAVEMVLDILVSRRRFSNRILGRIGENICAKPSAPGWRKMLLADQQPGNDILVLAAQAGMLHRGCSARRTRAAMAGNEFGLGVFAFGACCSRIPSGCRTVKH